MDPERLRRQAANIAKLVASVNEYAAEPASGDVVCDLCRLEYRDHPPWDFGLTLLCNGRLVQL